MRIGGSSSTILSAYAEQRSVRAGAKRGAGGGGEEATGPSAVPPLGPPATEADAEPPQATDEQSATGLPDRSRLSEEQKAEVLELQRRDAEVRAHEAAHAAAAGSLGGGASYEYTTGPDGRSYAIGGEVPVRIASGRTPEETLRNAAQVRSAALAPAEPSAQDRAVAVEAAAMEAAARAELAARSAMTRELANARQQSSVERDPVTLPSPGQETGGAEEAEAASPPSVLEEQLARGPEEIIRELESEQRLSRSGWRHLHLETSCGSCGNAAAAYR